MVEGAADSTFLLRRKHLGDADAPSTTLRVVPLPRTGSPSRERDGVPFTGEDERTHSYGAVPTRFRRADDFAHLRAVRSEAKVLRSLP